MRLLGDGLAKLIKTTIAPVIFCTVITSTVGMESMKTIGRIGVVVLPYSEIVSTITPIIGLIVVNVV